MKVLVLNCGSSSIKYQLIDMENENLMAKGYLEKIGLPDSFLTHTVNGEKHKIEQVIENHEEGIKLVLSQLTHPEYGVIKSFDEIGAIGHRLAHGGDKISEPTLIDENVINVLKEFTPLAPLHNPAEIVGVEACKKVLPDVPMVGVFDTAFNQTIPEKAYMYAIPYEYYEKYGIRKYGFHGTSYKFVSKRVAEIMDKSLEDLKIVSCHLGQGASVCAINGGKAVDNSLGFTSLAGLPMGTRCGDIDPSIVTFLMKKENLTTEQMDKILNKQSGKLGISGVMLCTSFSYVLLRLKVYLANTTAAPLVKFQHIIQLFTVLLTAILISLFFGVLVLVGKIQGTARVVNYAGLVRGKTQRIVKLEISGTPEDDLLGDVASYIEGLRFGSSELDLVQLDDADFQTKMTALSSEFDDLRNELILVRRRRHEWPRPEASGRQKAGKEHPGCCTKQAVKETFS